MQRGLGSTIKSVRAGGRVQYMRMDWANVAQQMYYLKFIPPDRLQC